MAACLHERIEIYPICAKIRSLFQKALRTLFSLQDRWHLIRYLPGIAPYLSPMYISEALEFAFGIESEYDRVNALIALVPYLEHEQLKRILNTLRTEDSLEYSPRLIASIAPRLKKEEQRNAIRLGLTILRSTKNKSQATLLGDLVPYMDKDLLKTTLDVSLKIKDKYELTLQALGMRFSSEQLLNSRLKNALDIADETSRAKALRELTPALTEEMASKVLSNAFSMVDETNRSHVLAAMISKVGVKEHEAILDAVLAIKNINTKVDLLAALVRYLKGEPKQRGLKIALESISKMTDMSLLGDVIAMVASQLDEQKKSELLLQGLDMCLEIESEFFQAYSLMGLCLQLNEPEKGVAFQKALSLLHGPRKINDFYSVLEDRVSRLPTSYIHKIFSLLTKNEEYAKYQWSLSKVLRMIIPYLDDQDRIAATMLADEVVRTIPHKWGRVSEIALLVPLCNEERQKELLQIGLDTALSIEEYKRRAEAMLLYKPFLKGEQLNQLKREFRQTIANWLLSLETANRAEVLNLGIFLAPTLSSDGAEKMYNQVKDICTEWRWL